MLRLVRLLLLLPPSTSRVTTASVLLLLLSPVGSVAGLPAVWLVALLLPLLLGLALGWWAVAAGAALCRQQAQVGSQFLFVAVLKTGLPAVPPMQPGLPAHEDRHIVGLGFEEEADFKPLACCLCADRFRSSECICMCSFSDCQQHGAAAAATGTGWGATCSQQASHSSQSRSRACRSTAVLDFPRSFREICPTCEAALRLFASGFCARYCRL